MVYYFSPFRSEYKEIINNIDSGACLLCDKENLLKQQIKCSDGKIVENEHYMWIVNWFPKFESHTMLVPKRHIIDPSDETQDEVLARKELQDLAQKTLLKLYPDAGIEIFLQWGNGSASSIRHIHWHILPASPDDKLRALAKLGHYCTQNKDEEKVVIFPIEIKNVREQLLEELAKFL
jgi:diadenosine tetraphosphate (Ap4A) HIT family hydrolase